MDDQTYMDDARAQREHERKVAHERRVTAGERRAFIGWCLLGAGMLAIVLAIVAGIYLATESDRQAREHERQRQADIAKTCIQEGNIWHDGACLIARKPS